jgi:3-deoxy-manno-octulosonate cytidylyltransferase (CMP-KDO synthetase)
MPSLIVIPARYGSTRLPGKPLHKIAGVRMLDRVVFQAKAAIDTMQEVELVVATDHDEIYRIASSELNVRAVKTSVDCPSGSDRACEVLDILDDSYDCILNLQGDVPLIESQHIQAVLQSLLNNQSAGVATPVVQLSWSMLDTLRLQKEQTPFSGTTVVMNTQNRAIWFSKNIIPAIRNEEELRTQELSPVFKHIGLYGYRVEALRQFKKLSQGHFEVLEGLEQLRFIENGIPIQCVPVIPENYPLGIGVDTLDDVARVEALLKSHGDPMARAM